MYKKKLQNIFFKQVCGFRQELVAWLVDSDSLINSGLALGPQSFELGCKLPCDTIIVKYTGDI